jgi:hypothetical protein
MQIMPDEPPDYAGLDKHTNFTIPVEQREIRWGREEMTRENHPSEDESSSSDDEEDNEATNGTATCREMPHVKSIELNCNTFHELDLIGSNPNEEEGRLVGMGSWRDVFILKSIPEAVLRIATVHKSFGTTMYDKMRTEGTISALLDPHPLLVNTYGFCALSMFNEIMIEGDMDDNAIPYVLYNCACLYECTPCCKNVHWISGSHALLYILFPPFCNACIFPVYTVAENATHLI